MLDLGANIECDKNNLIQFAFMGQAFARIVIGIKNPKVSLLNVPGVYEIPIAIIIGKRPIIFGQNIQKMPAYTNNPLLPLQELQEVFGLTIELTKHKILSLNQIVCIQNDTNQQSSIEDSSQVSDMDDEIPF